VHYPAESKGQIYIPSINWILFAGCLLIIILFKKSSNMEAAYGLSITINMLMTTALLLLFFRTKQKSVSFFNRNWSGVFFLN
jgi:KUP system potassium uptake protein